MKFLVALLLIFSPPMLIASLQMELAMNAIAFAKALSSFFASQNVLQMIGVLGFICYLSLFSALQFGMINGNSAKYTLFNVLAASLVSVGLVADFNLASALIQGSWIIIGLCGLALRLRTFRPWRSNFTQTASDPAGSKVGTDDLKMQSRATPISNNCGHLPIVRSEDHLALRIVARPEKEKT